MGTEGREPTDYERHLRSARAKHRERRLPNDSAPEFGGTVRRKIQGRERSVPIVTQLGLPQQGDIPQPVRRVNTGGRLKAPTPTEMLGIQSAEGHQDPVTRKEAERQQYAIKRNIQRRKKEWIKKK